jgi:hypothetical protein
MPDTVYTDLEYTNWRDYARQRSGRVSGLMKSLTGDNYVSPILMGAAKQATDASVARLFGIEQLPGAAKGAIGGAVRLYKGWTTDGRVTHEPTKPSVYSKSELFETKEVTRAAARNA